MITLFRSAVCISSPSSGKSWGPETSPETGTRFNMVAKGATGVEFDIVPAVYEPGDESWTYSFNGSRYAAESDTLVSFKLTDGSDKYLRHEGYWMHHLDVC